MVSLNLIPPEVDQLLLVGRHWKVTVGKEELSISERKEFPKKWDTDVSFKGVVNTLYPHRNDPVKFTRDLSKAYTDKKPTPGQNNEKPSVSMFPDHAVVLVREKANVYVFDPSYKGSQPKMFAIKGPSNLDGQKLVDSEAGQAALRAYQNLAFGGFVKFKRTPISKDSVVYELKARGLSDDSELLIKVRLAIPYK
jgi:hypothetical protein